MHPLASKRATLLASLVLLIAPAAAPAEAAQAPIALEVALGDVSLNKVPFLIAADAGLYTKNGLDVHQFITPVAAEVARQSGVVVPPQHVKAGDAPIAIGGGSPMMYQVGHDARAVQRVLLATTEDIIKDHIIAAASIRSLQDMKGKRLGYSVPGAVTHVGALAFARHMGWEPGKDITLVGNGNALNPLKEGREDGFLGSAMTIALAPEMNLKDLIDLTPFKFPVAGSSIMAERTWLPSHRDEAARFVRASVEAIALMKTDKQAFDAALAKWFNIKDPVTAARMFEAAREFPAKPYPAVEGIKATLALYDSPEMRKHRAEEFYDVSFIAELDRSGFIERLYK